MDKVAHMEGRRGPLDREAAVTRWRATSFADVLDQYGAAEREGLPMLAEELRVVLDDRLATIEAWDFTTGGPTCDALHGRQVDR